MLSDGSRFYGNRAKDGGCYVKRFVSKSGGRCSQVYGVPVSNISVSPLDDVGSVEGIRTIDTAPRCSHRYFLLRLETVIITSKHHVHFSTILDGMLIMICPF